MEILIFINLNGRHARHQNQWTLIHELQQHNLIQTIRSREMNKIGSRILCHFWCRLHVPRVSCHLVRHLAPRPQTENILKSKFQTGITFEVVLIMMF